MFETIGAVFDLRIVPLSGQIVLLGLLMSRVRTYFEPPSGFNFNGSSDLKSKKVLAAVYPAPQDFGGSSLNYGEQPARRSLRDREYRADNLPFWGDTGRVLHPTRDNGMEPERELILEDVQSIRVSLWRKARYIQDVAKTLDARIEHETLDGRVEAVEVCEVLERLQALSLEVREELDAYQQRHGRWVRQRPADQRRGPAAGV
jgi:hypothetical protein